MVLVTSGARSTIAEPRACCRAEKSSLAQRAGKRRVLSSLRRAGNDNQAIVDRGAGGRIGSRLRRRRTTWRTTIPMRNHTRSIWARFYDCSWKSMFAGAMTGIGYPTSRDCAKNKSVRYLP